MIERKGFWARFWALFGLHLHYFVIDEMRREPNGNSQYWAYKRRFWHFYTLNEERDVWQVHLETPFRRSPKTYWFAIRFHIGNVGSETPWDGHLTLFGFSWYWGHTGFRKLADRLTRCSGTKYDSREWLLHISDGKLWWKFANHDDMCNKNRVRDVYRTSLRQRKKRRRAVSWRYGVLNLSIPEAIWGPKRYSYENVARFQTLIKLPEDDYAVILTLHKVYFGRTKVDKKKHTVSCSVDVDAPRGIPTHVDHSGGYKGDRTYGFGVKMPDSTLQLYEEVWPVACEDAVTKWVERERARTGFVKPDPVA